MPEAYFVPGQRPTDPPFIGGSHWVAPWREGVMAYLVEGYTQLGELVLVPFCDSPTPVREAMAAGRPVVAGSANPLLWLSVQMALDPLPRQALLAAFTHLGDSLKRGKPLRESMTELYRTRCPACGQVAEARYFIWTREPADPRQKWIDCTNCGLAALYPVDAADLALLDNVETRGLHYHFLLDRTATVGDPLRERAENWLDLYTPRSLYVVAEMLLKIESLFPEGATQLALKAALLTCLERASSLNSEPDPQEPPPSLRPPARFIEHNVWQLFTSAIERQAVAAQPPAISLKSSYLALTAGPPTAAYLHSGPTSSLAQQLPTELGRVALVVTSPPLAAPVFWTLSYVWSGWLLGARAATPLKRLVTQPWPDWAWYQAAVTAAMRALRPTLAPSARWLFIFREADPRQGEALALASLAAGFEIEAWLMAAPDQHQLVLRLAPLDAPPPLAVAELEQRVRAETGKAALEALELWAEPLPRRPLRLAAWRRLLARGWGHKALASLPGDRALPWLGETVAKSVDQALAEEERIAELTGEGDAPVAWWLAGTPSRGLLSRRAEPVERALSDRAELAVLAALRQQPGRSTAEVIQLVYRDFPGSLTPPAGLAEACLAAYGLVGAEGDWRVHPDDTEVAWQGKLIEFGRTLQHLGQRLGFQPEFDQHTSTVIWQETSGDGQVWATFTLWLTAEVTELLFRLNAPTGQRSPASQWSNLVIPAARASLWRFKLQTMPWLHPVVAAGGWTFIKWEHLQALAGRDDATRHDLRTISGLEPLVEQATGQIPLF